MNGSVMTLARWLARKAVRGEWRSQGRRLAHVPLAELTHAARAYLASHPELIEEARVRCAELSKSAPRAKA